MNIVHIVHAFVHLIRQQSYQGEIVPQTKLINASAAAAAAAVVDFALPVRRLAHVKLSRVIAAQHQLLLLLLQQSSTA